MKSSYKTIVIRAKGIRIKGDDTSSELALEIDQKSKEMSTQGFKLLAVTLPYERRCINKSNAHLRKRITLVFMNLN